MVRCEHDGTGFVFVLTKVQKNLIIFRRSKTHDKNVWLTIWKMTDVSFAALVQLLLLKRNKYNYS